MGGFAWVTLATNDSYSLGALVLAHSLRRAGTIHQLAVLITPGVTPSMREKLGSVFDSVVEVNVLDSQDAANLALLARPDLGITFTKLHCWRLTQYDKCCFLDADTLVIQNVDELSEREELSAAPDVGWPDCFNSGVFVFKPSNETFNALMGFALQFGSFDGGDQGLLNLYFKDWAHKDITRHLPFIYNMSSSATYSYLPAFKQFGTQVKIIHFLGTSKPWLCYLDSESKVVQVPGEFNHIKGLLQFWWDIFCQDVHPSLTPSMRVDSSFFQAPHTHPAHQEMNPALPTHNIPSMLFIDPWDDYVERLQTETQQQKQKDGWLEIVGHDQRQRGCDDQITENTSENDEHSHERDTSENDVHGHKRHTPEWSDTGHNNRKEPLSNSLPSNPHSSESFSFNSRFSTPPLANNVSGDHGMDGHTENTNSAGLAGAFSQLTLGEPRSAEQTALEDHLRRQSWEQGHIDYMGRDSFDNIWNKILKTLGGPVSAPTATSEPSSTEPSPAPAVASAPSVPEPSSAPVVVPEPSQAPAAVPEPSPVSAAVLEPTPAPVAVPEPAPAPVAVPEPAPAPVAVPEAAPAPVAVPEPSPAPVVVPEPSPVSAPVPAVAAAPAPAPAAVPVPAAAPAPSPVSAPAPPAATAAPPAPAPAAAAPVTPAPAATAAPAPSPVLPAATSPAPPTPTVTTATPPTSPPIASPPQPQPSPEALKVDPTPPGTPPVAPGSSDPLEPTASAPVPPKRKGSGSTKGKK